MARDNGQLLALGEIVRLLRGSLDCGVVGMRVIVQFAVGEGVKLVCRGGCWGCPFHREKRGE